MIEVYGVITDTGEMIDTSATLHGAKCFATRNGYTRVGRRVGYNVTACWTNYKISKLGWQKESN